MKWWKKVLSTLGGGVTGPIYYMVNWIMDDDKSSPAGNNDISKP